MLDIFDKIPKYHIEIGVFSPKTGRTEKVKAGVTNAEILFINENGSPIRHIPARPVLEYTIQHANKKLLDKHLDAALDKYIETEDINEFEKELQKMCIRMENYARKLIYDNDGTFEPNAPSVVKAKGDNHPLFNTGQLARSITCQLVKEN